MRQRNKLITNYRGPAPVSSLHFNTGQHEAFNFEEQSKK
jgi:hypothetical protein